MRPAIVGESIKRIIDYVGHKTISDVHLGDIGLPIGEVIYASLRDKLKPEDLTLEYLNKVYPEMSALVKVDEEFEKLVNTYTDNFLLSHHVIFLNISNLGTIISLSLYLSQAK